MATQMDKDLKHLKDQEQECSFELQTIKTGKQALCNSTDHGHTTQLYFEVSVTSRNLVIPWSHLEFDVAGLNLQPL